MLQLSQVNLLFVPCPFKSVKQNIHSVTMSGPQDKMEKKTKFTQPILAVNGLRTENTLSSLTVNDNRTEITVRIFALHWKRTEI